MIIKNIVKTSRKPFRCCLFRVSHGDDPKHRTKHERKEMIFCVKFLFDASVGDNYENFNNPVCHNPTVHNSITPANKHWALLTRKKLRRDFPQTGPSPLHHVALDAKLSLSKHYGREEDRKKVWEENSAFDKKSDSEKCENNSTPQEFESLTLNSFFFSRVHRAVLESCCW